MLKKVMFLLVIFLFLGFSSLVFSYNLNDGIKLQGQVLEKRRGEVAFKVSSGFCAGVHVFQIINKEASSWIKRGDRADFILLGECKDFSPVYIPQKGEVLP